MYTDKIMNHCVFLHNDIVLINIISCAIAEIVLLLSTEYSMGVKRLNKLLDDTHINTEVVFEYMKKIFKILNFPLATLTYVTYEMLLSEYHYSVRYLYQYFCEKLMIYNIYIDYCPAEIFGSILFIMKSYHYKNNIGDILYFDDHLKIIINLYPNKIFLHKLLDVDVLHCIGGIIAR
jgi:hypothetical protein